MHDADVPGCLFRVRFKLSKGRMVGLARLGTRGSDKLIVRLSRSVGEPIGPVSNTAAAQADFMRKPGAAVSAFTCFEM